MSSEEDIEARDASIRPDCESWWSGERNWPPCLLLTACKGVGEVRTAEEETDELDGVVDVEEEGELKFRLSRGDANEVDECLLSVAILGGLAKLAPI